MTFWLLYRLKVASEFDTIEWWYQDNMVFMFGFLAIVIGTMAVVFHRMRQGRD